MTSIYFIHPWVHDVPSFLKQAHLNKELSERLVWNAEAPDILFASEWIYYKRKAQRQFKKLWPKAKIRIMYCGEAIEPDMNLFDYGIGFSNKFQYGDRFIRILSPLDMFDMFINRKVNDITTVEQAKECLRQKKGFCNFLYSNPHAHHRRDQLFYDISTYKRVDSLGRHLNNVGKLGTGFVGHAGETKDIKSLYKFSIACENAEFDGYTSEKVYTSLCAHTIPIYWGNKDFAEDLNPKAVISVRDFKTTKDLLDYIEYVDTHDDAWIEKIMQPWMSKEQLEHHRLRTEHYLKFFDWIFDGTDINQKKRLAEGTHEDNYRKRIIMSYFPLELNIHTYPIYWDKLKKKIIKK